ncbi:MAG: hypothetical protein GKR94_15960 [Gammaproteobacteria bacterium]|nr:hypothetical protein [Gammaproteobacteria bacterium]
MLIDSKERRHLRAKAHALKPVVIVGEAGLHDAVLAEIAGTLTHHELIKVRLPAIGRSQRDTLCRQIADLTQAALVQTVGRIAVLYKRRPPQAKTPKGKIQKAKTQTTNSQRLKPAPKRAPLSRKRSATSKHSSRSRSRN